MILTTPTPTPTATLVPRQTSGGITANLPLTTVFPVPTDCLGSGGGSYGLLVGGTVSDQPSAFRDYSWAGSSCYPPSLSALEYPGTYWYSPGVCPSSYSIAYWGIATTNNDGGVTQAWCCPSGMAFSTDSNNDAYCQTFVASSTQINIPNTSGPQPYSGFVGLQWPISVQWQSTDLPNFLPASAPLLQLAAQSTGGSSASGSKLSSKVNSKTSLTAASPSTPTPANPKHPHTPSATAAASSGLSTGAQAGIGVGIGLPCLALLIIGIWFFLHRQRKRRAATASDGAVGDEKRSQPFVDHKAELADTQPVHNGDQKFGGAQVAELEPQRDGLHEMEGQNKMAEPAELEGDAGGVKAPVEVSDVKSPSAFGKTETETAARSRSRDRL